MFFSHNKTASAGLSDAEIISRTPLQMARVRYGWRRVRWVEKVVFILGRE
jgi:hypothetical protein